MEKKTRNLLGCLIGVSIITLTPIAIVVFMIFKVADTVKEGIAQIEESAEFDRLNQDFPFRPPAQASVDPERLDVYFDTRAEIVALVDEYHLPRRYREMIDSEKRVNEGDAAGLGRMMDSTMAMFDMIPEAKEILKARQISPREYGYHLQLQLAAPRRGLQQEDAGYGRLYTETKESMTSLEKWIGLPQSHQGQSAAFMDSVTDPLYQKLQSSDYQAIRQKAGENNITAKSLAKESLLVFSVRTPTWLDVSHTEVPDYIPDAQSSTTATRTPPARQSP